MRISRKFVILGDKQMQNIWENAKEVGEEWVSFLQKIVSFSQICMSFGQIWVSFDRR